MLLERERFERDFDRFRDGELRFDFFERERLRDRLLLERERFERVFDLERDLDRLRRDFERERVRRRDLDLVRRDEELLSLDNIPMTGSIAAEIKF